MNCVYCQAPVPDKWYEYHCIPVARVNGEWIDMYNRLSELELPIRQVAHWACHMKNQSRAAAPSHVVPTSARK